jgi:hypothetical protein
MSISWFSRRGGAFYSLLMNWGENLLPQVLHRSNRRSLNEFGVNNFHSPTFPISEQEDGNSANDSFLVDEPSSGG